MFITSQEEFTTNEISIFFNVQAIRRQILQPKLQVISLRHIGRLSGIANNVGLIFW